MSKEGKPVKGRVFPTILPEIRSLIEISRHHAAITANLALVNLYWNIGRIITQDIQKNEKRAEYGEQLIEELARELGKEYGSGYSAKNLWDMKRFFGAFKILQAVPGEFSDEVIRQPLANKSVGSKAVQPPSDDLLDSKFVRQCLINLPMKRFSRHCLENLPAKQFGRQCLPNLQAAF